MLLHSLGAVLAGFVGMAAVVMTGSALASLAMGRAPGDTSSPPPVYLAFDFTLGMLAATAGGLIATRLAPTGPWSHALALAGVVLAMAVVCVLSYGDKGPPRWYQALLSLSSAALIAVVGWLA